MASSKRYLEYVLDLLSELDDISYRAMMGEYVLYYRGRVFGGVYDDRFLIKPTEFARRILPDADVEIPYDGAKGMLLVESEDRELIGNMVEGMYDELPKPKKRS